MIWTAILKTVSAMALAAAMQPAQFDELEAVEHSEPCRVCKASTDEADLYDGYCPECFEAYGEGPWCDACGELLCGSDAWINCNCHGIRGYVCESCADWHRQFE